MEARFEVVAKQTQIYASVDEKTETAKEQLWLCIITNKQLYVIHVCILQQKFHSSSLCQSYTYK